jgi:hypothetical protein
MELKYLYAPSGVKAGTAYGVIPNSASADFSSFVSDTDGTRVDENGFITDVEANVPRIDYTGGGCPSLLLEPSSTNYIPYSEDFSQSAWSKLSGGTGSTPIVTENYAISPSGEFNASRIQFDKGSGTTQSDLSILAEFLTVPSGIDATKSIYVKSNTSEEYDLVLYGTSDASGTNVAKIRVTSEWQRFDVFKTLTGTSTGLAIGLREISVSGLSETADVLIWGAQLENQSYATSYIPTYGATSTRSQDVGGSTLDISSEFDSREGTFMFEGSSSDFSGANRVSLNNSVTTFQDRISISAETSSVVRFLIIYEAGDVGGSFALVVSDMYANIKIAIKWSSGSVVCYANGIEIFDRTNIGDFSQDSLNRVTLANANESTPFKGRVKQLRVYDEALSNSEMVKLTTL